MKTAIKTLSDNYEYVKTHWFTNIQTDLPRGLTILSRY